MRFIQCRACAKLTESPSDDCEHCGELFEHAKKGDFYIHVFASGYYEHIDENPIYIKNRAQLREETRRRGQVSPYAEC